jgi:2-polyprenyl-3-methyl-5-hydroxy-6-metoxy-1,4-benzoquinol methylase
LLKFNKVRTNFLRRSILQDSLPQLQTREEEELFREYNVVDVGCGAGILAESLGRLGMGKVLGIDPTDKCVELANQHLQT